MESLEENTSEKETPTNSVSEDVTLVGECVTYPDGGRLQAALGVAKEALPEVETAYKPSGRIPLVGLIVFLPTAAVAAAVVFVVCVAVCLGISFIEVLFEGESSEPVAAPRKLSALVAVVLLLVDLGLICAVAGGPGYAFGWLAKQCRIRNLWLPGLVSGIAGLLTSGALFLPVLEGATLAPIYISFWFIGLRWPLVILGMIAGVGGAPALTVDYVSKQKFCEEGLVYLKRHRTVRHRFDVSPVVLALLAENRFAEALGLPRIDSTDKAARKHCAEVTLWSHELANTAFVEMTARFCAKKATEGKKKASEETESWLVYSAKVDKHIADQIAFAVA